MLKDHFMPYQKKDKFVVLYTLTFSFLDSIHEDEILDWMISGTLIKVKYFELSDSSVLQ